VRVPRESHASTPVVGPDAEGLDETLPRHKKGHGHAQVDQRFLVEMLPQLLVEFIVDLVAVLEQPVSQT